jgi:cobalt-zinc-cadmium efflux system membrane fusion protein
MAAKGAISERLVQERTSTREVADAYFHSVCEQSRFDAQHEKELRKANLEHAERVLAVNQQRLRMLLGPFTEISQSTDDSTICQLVLRAPFNGTVEERLVAEGTQFAASQTLFVVANLDTLWVSAQIYENEWAELAGGNVQELQVECPALPGEKMTARVQYVGTSMSAETRAVPLVAELPNPQRRLKPGMFAWVSVPLGPVRRGLAVPAGAIERHEHATFVFVEQQPGVYRKRDVALGLTTPDVVEIKSGLAPGDRVVDRGAFYLKSELLLEGMEPSCDR